MREKGKRMHKKKGNDIFYTFGLVMQLGISFVAPILLMIYVSVLVVRHWNLPKMAILVAILIGLAAGAVNVYKLLRRFFYKK